nr:M14 family zinc carboxypeptidase [Bacillus sp. ISL-47]
MVRDIKDLASRYPDIIKYKSIGNSEYGRPIYAVSLGTGNANLFINGSHHAREWMTTNLSMNMLEEYAKMYKGQQTFGGYNVKKVLDETTIWFVPMVNPDGVTLQQYGLSKFPSSVHSSLIKMNEGSTDFKRWKANAKGIDLNRQYNADWANIRNNYPSPRWSNYKGTAPEQAAETKAIVKFTKEINPDMAIAYHTSGEILYWYFHQSGSRLTRDQNYAKKISQYTGYNMVAPTSNPSGGGYTDWFVLKYGRPGFTPELGKYAGNTHVPVSQFDTIWGQNKYVGLYSASESYKLYLARGGQPKPVEARVKIDGVLLSLQQPALYMDGRVLVPVRGVFEKLGATIQWEQSTNTIIARKDDTTVELRVGSKTAKVNGEAKTLDVAPIIVNNTTLIPLRFVSEALGAQIGWHQESLTALISSPAEKDVTPPEKPVVNPVTDITSSVKGASEANALVTVKKDGTLLGQSKAGADGRFSVDIPVQKSESVLTITATDAAGNTSPAVSVTVTYTSNFTDTVGHWAQQQIAYLKDQNITGGLSDGSFGVNRQISRSESAALLVRALKLDSANVTDPNFDDVTKDHYYYKSIAAVYTHDIMQGMPGNRFNPDKTLTRAEMAAILVNAFDLKKKESAAWPDVKKDHWAYDAITILSSNELIEGYPDGTFRPDTSINRAEFAALLVRVLTMDPQQAETLNEEPAETNEQIKEGNPSTEEQPEEGNTPSEVQAAEHASEESNTSAEAQSTKPVPEEQTEKSGSDEQSEAIPDTQTENGEAISEDEISEQSSNSSELNHN